MSTRTPRIDRRIASLLLDGIPDLPEGTVKGHLGHKDRFHEVEGMVLRSNLTKVDMSELALVLAAGIRTFAPGVIESVWTIGSQFAGARMTTVPGGETFATQRNKVIKFWTDWHFKKLGKDEELIVAPSIGSEVIYLPDLVEGSLFCTYDEIEGKTCVQDVLELPKVEGLRWIVGNAPTINRVLANHLKETGQYLLPLYTWTTDTHKSPGRGPYRLVVGVFGSNGVCVLSYLPVVGRGDVGLFVLGVPQDS